MSYVTQADLEAVLGTAVVIAIYDDANTGSVDVPTITTILALASSRVDSYLARVYPGPFPITQTPIPEMVKDAALAWARAFSYERHPEYVRQFGDRPRKEAEDLCERLAEAKEFLSDFLASPEPGNVGGIVIDSGPRMLVDAKDGTYQGGDF